MRRALQWMKALSNGPFDLEIAAPTRPTVPCRWLPLPVGGRGHAKQAEGAGQLTNPSGASNAVSLLRLRERLVWPDPDLLWLFRHAGPLDQAFERADIVITSGPPESLHLVCSALARRHDRRLILDMRDPWLPSGHIPARNRKPRVWIEKLLRRYCLNTADAVTTVHPDIVEEVRAVRPGLETHMIGQAPLLPSVGLQRDLGQGHINLVYTGGFSRSSLHRKLAALINEVEPVFKANPTARLHLVGPLSSDEIALAAQHDQIEVHGPQPIEQIGQFQTAADALVLFSPQSSRFPGGKLTEYVAAGRPILVLGDGPWTQDPILQRASPAILEGTSINVLYPDAKDTQESRSDHVDMLRAVVRRVANA